VELEALKICSGASLRCRNLDGFSSRKLSEIYYLTENALPSCVDLREPIEEERRRFFLEKALDAWGLAEIKDIAQYFYP
jgi:uncharacterized protein YcaQ